ncbi:CP4-57 prophage; DUF932 domain-containing protein YfjQ [Burkholderia latens]|uniref:DUF932 domain-containing protein n=1 Tax=Burkholderia latens TaxID=488446 RepID=UPI0039A69CE7
MQLAARFASRSPAVRSNSALTDEQIFKVAPSIFAEDKHESRSERYTYIPTIEVLRGLRSEGFEPYMAMQTRVRDESMREHTKHLVRLRHVNHVVAVGQEVNEIILVNSHNGTSSYQMLAGVFRFICSNGMVSGDTFADIRIPHKGDVISEVIEGAHRIVESFEVVDEQREGMKALTLSSGEQTAFARAALALRYDTAEGPAPITEEQVNMARRWEDRGSDLWTTFNRAQENLTKGGLRGRNSAGRTTTTRAVTGIAQNISVNRGLWVLAEEMRKLRAA